MTLRDYLRKMRGSAQGGTRGGPPRVSAGEIFWSWAGAFVGIGVIAWVEQRFFDGHDFSLLIGSIGASAVLVYGAPRSPLSQPRNLIGGHLVSALIGVACWKLLHPHPWLAAALAVSSAIAVMHALRVLHPPGGATALIAVVGSPDVHALGFFYALMPATLAPLILLAVALLVNNIARTRRYPEFWF